MRCFRCLSEFKNFIDFRDHFRNDHIFLDIDNFECGDCPQKFQSKKVFYKHVKNQHDLDTNVINTFESNIEDVNIFYSSPTVNNSAESIDKKLLNAEFNIKKTQKELHDSILKFILNISSKNEFHRKDILFIQQEVHEAVVQPILNSFKNFADTHLKHSMETYNIFSDLLSVCSSIFNEYNTDYNLQKTLKSENLASDIKEYNIYSETSVTFVRGTPVYETVQNTCIIMPLRFQMEKLFSNRSLLKDCLKTITNLEKENTTLNYFNCELWKKKKELYPNESLIPYLIYLDDIELNNPLGSHAKTDSTCFFYYSFPCLPYVESKCENIFLAACVKTQYMKQFSVNESIKELVNDLVDLEINGIQVSDENSKHSLLRPILCLIIGDNLALNSILGFSSSFSSNFYCRLCNISKDDSRGHHSIDLLPLRTFDSYTNNIIENNPKNTGVYFESIWNIIPSFHVTDNFYCDIMHDIFEGICNYNLSSILNYFINIKKYFDLDTLNFRKRNFHYGKIDIGNISGDIKKDHLSNRHFKMSSSEMMCFVHYLTLMIGDLVSHNDKHWKFLTLFIEIIDILLCFNIPKYILQNLKIKIENHNKQYVELFQDSLKPKHHNLLHYIKIIEMSGSLRNMWCFKYESKHKEFKTYARVITSRKNICLSMAKKYQFKYAAFLMSNICNDPYTFNDKYLEQENVYISVIKSMLPDQETIRLYNKCYYNSILYEKDLFVSKCIQGRISIYMILTIIKTNEDCFLFCQEVSISSLPSLVAYELHLNLLGQMTLIKCDELLGPPCTKVETLDNKTKIRLKKYFKLK